MATASGQVNTIIYKFWEQLFCWIRQLFVQCFGRKNTKAFVYLLSGKKTGTEGSYDYEILELSLS